MKLSKILSNDYYRLFVEREGRVVLGRNGSTLWLLTAVLVATFLAIAFSICMLLVDLLYAAVDPRIKAQYASSRKVKVKKEASANG